MGQVIRTLLHSLQSVAENRDEFLARLILWASGFMTIFFGGIGFMAFISFGLSDILLSFLGILSHFGVHSFSISSIFAHPIESFLAFVSSTILFAAQLFFWIWWRKFGFDFKRMSREERFAGQLILVLGVISIIADEWFDLSPLQVIMGYSKTPGFGFHGSIYYVMLALMAIVTTLAEALTSAGNTLSQLILYSEAPRGKRR